MEQSRFAPPFALPVPGDESRRTLRTAVKMRAHLRDRGTTKFEISVLDLSQAGFRAETSFTLWAGNYVWLTLPWLGSLEAVVAWRENLLYGCRFSKPLHPAVFAHIIALSERAAAPSNRTAS